MILFNEVPTLMAWFHVIASAVALLIASFLTVRRWRAEGFGRLFLMGATLCIALMVHVAGGLFQAQVLPVDVWAVFGTGGRIAILVVLVTVLTTRG